MSIASGNFIPTLTYNDLVAGIVCINDNNPFSEGSDAARLWFENEIKLKLGLVADIWPLEIRGDLIIDAMEHAERCNIS
ncbi:hypothetical protein [Bradyrhizobium japonicum]|uniref:hypothetical protein n=1 Tax=Bradyrhizobium japonicum TaxID=375 RepID=UPI001BAD0DF2|nr:hypothetical protein [Bradyrhizobium japonicum]MBR0764150.1 hypothetical protein [Bradyrhizobium japonicum]